ncbi:carboxylesterase [Penicillium malachiteum]|uniref:carboxylesterase n=1 Tax=Penicillium malachiteum TaxID=1324776 RepID=UPI0025498237|nr:carboxylesterase [Penicillium malachiteum]KAJ5736200.1 carboxylesterase [Penicillium malachiteum]
MRRWAIKKILAILVLVALLSFFAASDLWNALFPENVSIYGPAPLALTKNGTYAGMRNDYLAQDLFLGMPYALPPVGDLRFDIPHALNQSWNHRKEAKAYGPHCLTYGVSVPSALGRQNHHF